MYVSFEASETVQLSVTNEETSIEHYLRQPKRLVEAIADPQLMTQISGDLYELKMRPINFMEMYHFQPIVLLKVWSGSNGGVYLQSEDCQIEGIDYINRRFSLKLKGILEVDRTLTSAEQTTLSGQAELEVGVELPTALMFTPRPFLEVAGNKLLKSVLGRIKHKLTTKLVQDYRMWSSQATSLQTKRSAKLSPDMGF